MSTAQCTRLQCDNATLEHQARCISDYKGRLDAALVAMGKQDATQAQIDWLECEGFTRQSPSGTGVGPDTFAHWVFGPFKQRNLNESAKLMTFPGHIAIGWNRRQYTPVIHKEAQTIKKQLDARTLDPTSGDGYAQWLQPLPVIIAKEGKHRVDLFRMHDLEMLAKVRITLFPAATELELCRVWGTNRVWALRCLNSEFPDSFRRTRGEFAALPLPELSVPFFKAYGVRERSSRCFPWQVSLGLSESPEPFAGLMPHQWRSWILNDGYI